MPIALRPRDSSTSINSRYAAQALTERWPSCSGRVTASPESVITSMAAFEKFDGFGSQESVVTKVAGFEPSESVVTEVAAFARDFWPQLPGERTTIPAERR